MSSLPRSLLLDCNGALQLYVMCTTAHSKATQWKVCSREAGPGAVAGACRAGQRVRCTSTADRCVDRCSPRWCSEVYAAPAAALATWAGWACCWCWCLCQSAFGSNLYVCQLHQFRTSHASHCVCVVILMTPVELESPWLQLKRSAWEVNWATCFPKTASGSNLNIQMHPEAMQRRCKQRKYNERQKCNLVSLSMQDENSTKLDNVPLCETQMEKFGRWIWTSEKWSPLINIHP